MDTPTREELKKLQPIKEKGLYFVVNGEKQTPHNLYFGVGYNFNVGITDEGGKAFVHYNCALHPVFKADGTRFRIEEFRNVSAYYKDGLICDFYRQ